MLVVSHIASLAVIFGPLLLAARTAAAPGIANPPPTQPCSVYTGNMNKNAYHIDDMVYDTSNPAWLKAKTLSGYDVKLTPRGGPNFDLVVSVGNVPSRWNVFKLSTVRDQASSGLQDFYYKVDKQTICTVQMTGRLFNGLQVAEMRAY